MAFIRENSLQIEIMIYSGHSCLKYLKWTRKEKCMRYMFWLFYHDWYFHTFSHSQSQNYEFYIFIHLSFVKPTSGILIFTHLQFTKSNNEFYISIYSPRYGCWLCKTFSWPSCVQSKLNYHRKSTLLEITFKHIVYTK